MIKHAVRITTIPAIVLSLIPETERNEEDIVAIDAPRTMSATRNALEFIL
jgi:hypothetical protein